MELAADHFMATEVMKIMNAGTRLLTIIPKPLHIAGLILNQTKMMTTTML
jgi:hypothetical protein